MTRHVVIHHARHADEGVYRLVFAPARDVTEHIAVENPQFDPAADPGDENFDPVTHQAHLIVPRTTTLLGVPQEVVWDHEDPRWQDREPEDIAAEQRQIVGEAITRRIAEQERAEAASARATTELGGVGAEL